MDDTLNDDILRTSELLAKRGPHGMLDLMAQISAQFAATVAEAGREDVAAHWKASSAAMERLATTIGGAGRDTATPVPAVETSEDDDGNDEELEDGLDEEEDDTEDEEGPASEDDEPETSPAQEAPSVSPPPKVATSESATGGAEVTAPDEPKEREGAVEVPTMAAKERVKMKTVAGQFSVSPKVTTCRVRNVLDSGQRGELVGRANERGIEESEWRVETMTPERMRAWFGPGRFLFEWYGEDGKGGRMALGRSRAFRIFPDTATAATAAVQSVAAAPATAAAPSSGNPLEQAFQISRYVDEKVHQERELEARRQDREHEMKKLQMEISAKERLARLQLEAKMETTRRAAPVEAGGYAIDEGALLARIEETVAARVSEALKAKGGEGDDFELPGWLKAIGIDKSMLALARPQISQLIPGLLAKMQPHAPGTASLPTAVATPEPSPAVATPYPNVTRFVRKDGTG